MAARKTQRIPRSQRTRKGVELTLTPEAREALEDIPRGQWSEWVSDLIVKAWKRIRRERGR